MATSERGFAKMSPEKRRAAGKKGGESAQARGTGYRWKPGDAAAREAGRKSRRARSGRFDSDDTDHRGEH